MKKFDFRVTLSGEGADPDDAWLDAIDAFASAPGPIPDDYDILDPDDCQLDWLDWSEDPANAEWSSVDGIE